MTFAASTPRRSPCSETWKRALGPRQTVHLAGRMRAASILKGSQDQQSPRNPGKTILKDPSVHTTGRPRERLRRSPDIFPPPAVIAGAESPSGLFLNASVG